MTQDLNEEDLDDNALHEAVRIGDVEAVQRALKDGHNPNAVGLFGWSALHEATSQGNVELVKILLKHGSNPNKVDKVSSNTSLHYACAEDHPHCLHELLKKGGDANILNKNNETCAQLTRSSECLKILMDHQKNSAANVKTILNPLQRSAISMRNEKGRKEISTSFEKLHTEEIKKQPLSISRQSSAASADSGLSSTTSSNVTAKHVGNRDPKNYINLPPSPVKSQCSSYGSLTSLGSSSCSASDDSAGEFVLSFRYNSKKQELKICVWQIIVTSLISASQMPKGSNIQLYVRSTIIPPDEYQPNPALKKKSEVFRLQPGEPDETASAERQRASTSYWLEREAKVQFKNSMTLEYQDVSKHLVSSSTIQICLCVRPKRALIANKTKPNFRDPVLASREIPLDVAVKRIMKESFPTERHDVPGITRQAFPLDAVVSDNLSRSNTSNNTDPGVQISMTSVSESGDDRPASDGEMVKESSFMQRSTKSLSRLESVLTHSAPSVSPHVNVSIPSDQPGVLKSVKALSQPSNEKEKVKMLMPRPDSDVFNQFKYRCRANAQPGRGRSAATKSRSRLKSSGKLLLATATSTLQPNIAIVQALDDEERSVGSPSEEVRDRDFGPEDIDSNCERLYTHNRTNSSSSFAEIDESPSPSRRRKNFRQPSVPKSPSRQTTVPHRPGQDKETKSWRLQVDPPDARVDMTVPPVGRGDFADAGRSCRSSSADSQFRLVQRDRQKCKSQRSLTHRRGSAHRKLVYEETEFSSSDVLHSADNPCFIQN